MKYRQFDILNVPREGIVQDAFFITNQIEHLKSKRLGLSSINYSFLTFKAEEKPKKIFLQKATGYLPLELFKEIV